MNDYNRYLNDYMKRRWKARRLKAIIQLGGKCVKCGCDDTDLLEFDHIDRKTKSFTISKGASFSEKRFQAELVKCQLLCEKCHKDKSKTDGSQANVKMDVTCDTCGKIFGSVKAHAGHKAHCKGS